MTRSRISLADRHSINRRTLLKYSAATGAALSVGLKSPAIAQTRGHCKLEWSISGSCDAVLVDGRVEPGQDAGEVRRRQRP